jgi:hypothetical protein
MGAPLVIGLAVFFRSVLPKNGIFSLPLRLVFAQAIIISICMALWRMGIFFNGADCFPPYFFVPGAFIYAMTEVLIVGPLNDPLFARFPYQLANVLLLVVIPGLVGMILSGVQWYFFGWLYLKYRPRFTWRHPSKA